MRQAHRCRSRRLSCQPHPTRGVDVRLSVRRAAARYRRPARTGAALGGAQAMRTKTAPITLIEAITQALAWEMANDKAVLTLGEDFGALGRASWRDGRGTSGTTSVG